MTDIYLAINVESLAVILKCRKYTKQGQTETRRSSSAHEKQSVIICGEACLKGEGHADVCVSGTKGR